MVVRYPVTRVGYEQLQQELKMLKTVTRPKVIQAISEARAHGDLKENAEYHAAKEQQGFIEARIKHLEAKLTQAQVIDVMTLPVTGKVIFGATVQLLNLDTEEEVRYQIVCEDEADFKQGKISMTAPLARSLIGKAEGEVISFSSPKGEVDYEIIAVLHL